ncbi:hypothetical protein MLD38_037436 [Melastoma candidum]|uniref:Uncharacterized protein n=1 Tax=Melastoma candidum TaxID=119954 RepID=A0ACB9LPJ8_9MYRT|nr:hypothetical protein MLD38_037436 [Melastoma candidum]
MDSPPLNLMGESASGCGLGKRRTTSPWLGGRLRLEDAGGDVHGGVLGKRRCRSHRRESGCSVRACCCRLSREFPSGLSQLNDKRRVVRRRQGELKNVAARETVGMEAATAICRGASTLIRSAAAPALRSKAIIARETIMVEACDGVTHCWPSSLCVALGKSLLPHLPREELRRRDDDKEGSLSGCPPEQIFDKERWEGRLLVRRALASIAGCGILNWHFISYAKSRAPIKF